jgi:L-alanine-DL-glutamate epimerase-like enolase superfamily enzyme
MKRTLKPNGSQKYGLKDSRRDFLKKASIGGMGLFTVGAATQNTFAASQPEKSSSGLVVTDLKCTVMGNHAVVRIATNEGISGYSQIEPNKNWIKPFILFYKDWIIGMDPVNVERIMLKIRRMGGFKPWGAAVSSIEMALWDIAGKAAGLPVYRLLGGKIRDYVRPYGRSADTPEKFSIVKVNVGINTRISDSIPNLFYGTPQEQAVMHNLEPNPYGYDPATKTYKSKTAPRPNRGVITEQGMEALLRVVEEKKKELGKGIGMAVECGTGFTLSDAIKFAKAMEEFNPIWLEDLITGDYHPYVMADIYKELTDSTTCPIHTGEQIYLRENFRELIENKAVRVLGPDPADMGGIAELKWVAEYANLHSIQIAPHGIGDGVFGLAAQVQAGAAMPENYIAFEYPVISDQWWLEITDGLPDPIVKDGLIKVWDKPGIGVDFIEKKAKKYLSAEDMDFFD